MGILFLFISVLFILLLICYPHEGGLGQAFQNNGDVCLLGAIVITFLMVVAMFPLNDITSDVILGQPRHVTLYPIKKNTYILEKNDSIYYKAKNTKGKIQIFSIPNISSHHEIKKDKKTYLELREIMEESNTYTKILLNTDTLRCNIDKYIFHLQK